MLMTVLSPEQAIEFMKLDEYNKGIEDGEARGERRGIEIGEARGERRGIEIGKHNTSLNFAKTMLKNNYSIDRPVQGRDRKTKVNIIQGTAYIKV